MINGFMIEVRGLIHFCVSAVNAPRIISPIRNWTAGVLSTIPLGPYLPDFGKLRYRTKVQLPLRSDLLV